MNARSLRLVPAERPRRPWLGLVALLLSIALVAAAATAWRSHGDAQRAERERNLKRCAFQARCERDFHGSFFPVDGTWLCLTPGSVLDME